MDMTPRQIVAELDKYIVGQDKAKRAVAVALRNRYRRSMVPQELRDEITPKNIILKGPTGVGKTEIARRMARLVRAPFVKVEATKFTEVGYVGRDCESMIRDLADCAYRIVREEQIAVVRKKAQDAAEKRISKAIMEKHAAERGDMSEDEFREKIIGELREGKHDGEMVEVEMAGELRATELIPGGHELNLNSILGDLLPKPKKRRRLTVKEALDIMIGEEADKLVDKDRINEEAVRRCEQQGIVFIDEIDKIAASGKTNGADVSREGVQRDILPIVEGCTVVTKYGAVRTDFILFVAAGAFHISRMEDLIPELQGRFPIVVELSSLTKDDFVRILTTPRNALTLQYATLLAVDNIDLKFTDDAIEKIAEISEEINATAEDIGARRLHTVMEMILDDISFNAGGDIPMTTVTIDSKYVEDHVKSALSERNLKKYVL